MKLNGTPRHYMLLSQSQSDDEENNHLKGSKLDESTCKPIDPPPIMKKTIKQELFKADPKTLPMSPLRKLAFILSLCLCAAFITIFVWLVPCKNVAPTLDTVGDVVEKWQLNLQNISFTTDGILVNTKEYKSIFLFGYYNSETNSEGVLALSENDGKQLWQKSLYTKPTSFLCDVIDANEDNFSDCLIIGSGSLLTAIDINNGSIIWYIHNHNDIPNAENISLPVVLTDCDYDTVLDVVVSYSVSSANKLVTLALVSGRTGEIIGTLISLQQCVSPIAGQFSFTWQNQTSFIIFCSDGKEGKLWLAQAENICGIALNKTENVKLTLLYRNPYFSSNVQFMIFPSELGFVMVINGSKIVAFEPRHSKFRVKWSKVIETNIPWRIVSHDYKENFELVLLKSSSSISQVIGLNIYNGKEMWSKSFNGFATWVLELKQFFGHANGFILKVLNPIVESTENVTKSGISTIVKTIEEDYILFSDAHVSSTKHISSFKMYQYCDAISCKPDVYNNRKTALAMTLPNGAVDVGVYTDASSPSSLQTSIKLLRFEHLNSKCIARLGS